MITFYSNNLPCKILVSASLAVPSTRLQVSDPRWSSGSSSSPRLLRWRFWHFLASLYRIVLHIGFLLWALDFHISIIHEVLKTCRKCDFLILLLHVQGCLQHALVIPDLVFMHGRPHLSMASAFLHVLMKSGFIFIAMLLNVLVLQKLLQVTLQWWISLRNQKGNQLKSIEIHRNQWKSTEIHRNALNSIEIHRNQLKSIEIQRKCIEINWNQ